MGDVVVRDRILRAIFRVTRSAKRFRDAASACYRAGAFQFATVNRQKKEALYDLKDAGIMVACRYGWIEAVGTVGALTEYRGNGFCFHSLLRPLDAELPDADGAHDRLRVDAKPSDRHEMRLKDAEAVLGELPTEEEGFVRLSFDDFREELEASGDDDFYEDDVDDPWYDDEDEWDWDDDYDEWDYHDRYL